MRTTSIYDDSLNKKECDHIEMFPWNNKWDNIGCARQIENKLNKSNSDIKTLATNK